ncbi:hypothetical protein [Polaribacter septentrionalilitoris]|uniref:hypothetical protein n=1 Tax=Polaribacter septentrionalilitoris TaxID=2494657 RepID=UPI00135C647C|nr:hypothetical protein [Polaribacter septentrionalilitoris]
MELTKEQIKHIDHRLENEGIKYWDIRIELLDHVVSDVEKRLETGEDFKKAVHKSFIGLGWKGTFSHVNTQGWKNTNKFYRRMYLKGFIDFFKNLKNVMIFISCFFAYYYISSVLELKLFVKFSYVLFIIPTLIFFYESYTIWKKKYGKSVHKQYGLHYIISTTLLFQIVMLSLKPEGVFSVPTEYHKFILFVLIPVHLIFTYSGYKVYKKAIARVEKMRNQLLS